ncbi:MAG: D-glycero-beta-D-manno-heptose-7-phosphate kinase [bacterium]
MNAISETRLREILARFDSLSLVVVGDCMLDRYIWGVVERISPEAPVPVVHVSGESVRLGGAANVAANLLALGARVHLLGVIGDDDAGRAFQRALRERGLDAAGIIVDSARPTTVKERVIAQSQQVVRIDREDRAPAASAVVAKLCALAEPLVRAGNGVIVSDYAKGLVTADLASRVITMSRDAGRFVAVDPKAPNFACYAGASLITPNQGEAAQAAGFPIRDDEGLVRAGEAILRVVGAEAVLVTRGEQGMSLFERGGQALHLPTVAREVFDVTGAGDTVISTFMMAVGAGATLAEAAILSNHAAGAVIREVGAATISRDELASAALGREGA